MSQELSGHCLCGKVSWKAPGPVLWAGHCHCESCRRAASAPYASWLGLDRDSVFWVGSVRSYASSAGVSRGFCGHCGSPMYYKNDNKWPTEVHIYAQTLDDPETYAPKAHFHFDEHLTWVPAEDGLPRYAETSDNAEPL